MSVKMKTTITKILKFLDDNIGVVALTVVLLSGMVIYTFKPSQIIGEIIRNIGVGLIGIITGVKIGRKVE